MAEKKDSEPLPEVGLPIWPSAGCHSALTIRLQLITETVADLLEAHVDVVHDMKPVWEGY